MIITGRITKSDIANGERHDCFACPLALAVNRELKDGLLGGVGPIHPVSVEVRSGVVEITNGRNRMRALFLSSKLCSWIQEFDSGMKVEPIDFELSFEKAEL